MSDHEMECDRVCWCGIFRCGLRGGICTVWLDLSAAFCCSSICLVFVASSWIVLSTHVRSSLRSSACDAMTVSSLARASRRAASMRSMSGWRAVVAVAA